MKNRNSIFNTFLFPLLIAICSLFICTCASTPSGPDDLDIAIRDTSDYLNDNIPKGNKIVILNIQSDHAALSEYVIDELIANAVNDKMFSVVDRAQLDQIRMELNFQLSGEVSDQSALEIGKFLGAQTIVSGTIGELADRHRMRIRALNVETAEVQGQYNRNINKSRLIAALMKGGRSQTANYGQASAQATAGGSGRTASGNSGNTVTATDNGRTTQAPSQPVTPAGPQIGRYTYWPRLRATRAGLPVNDIYIPQITVTKDFIVIHFCRNATGTWEDGGSTGISGFYNKGRNITLQDLDNPSRFFTEVSAQETHNGMGRIWNVSYRYFNATRLKLEGKQYDSDAAPFVFEEIIIGEPDR
jgi:hypothetical protein